MAYTPPTTRTTGDLVTAATWNADLVDNIRFLASPPACRVWNNANQSIPNNVLTALLFNSERYDTDSMHSTVTNTSRITFTTAGVYVVFAHLNIASNATGKRSAGFRLNGGTFIGELTVPPVSGADTNLSPCTTYKFAAGDYVECYVNQTSGVALNVVALGDPYRHTFEFGATWVGLGT
jgi:hypothetical protein